MDGFEADADDSLELDRSDVTVCAQWCY